MSKVSCLQRENTVGVFANGASELYYNSLNMAELLHFFQTKGELK
mgnify:CR=1 FL=1|jgi:hypothetical protein